MDGINVLSLFDGISCGLVALNRISIPVRNYFSSEIDRYAIEISKKNHASIARLGDVGNWKSWNLPNIDLLIAGSPCQGFSKSGKGLNFEDPRSKLFFVFIAILKEERKKNPDLLFLLENVYMKKEWEEIITEYIGVEPILINSSLVSAQNRKRLYWTNIPGVEQPCDKKILLKDIIFKDGDIPARHNIYGGFKEKEPRKFFTKAPTIRTAAGGGHIPSLIDTKKVGIYQRSHGFNKGGVNGLNGKSPTLTTSRWENNNYVTTDLLHTEKAIAYMNRRVQDGRTHWDFRHHSDILNDKSACITANTYKGIPYNVLVTEGLIRKFHPIECERLQTLEDNYTEGVSNTQRYKMIRNGWTVDVVAHILSYIKEKYERTRNN